jgi:hypothetical protein
LGLRRIGFAVPSLSCAAEYETQRTLYCNEVTITRDGDYAWIAYKEEGIGATRLPIGPEIAEMSDREILELHNECLRAQAKRAAEYKHVAVEVFLGSAQIEYVDRCDQ